MVPLVRFLKQLMYFFPSLSIQTENPEKNKRNFSTGCGATVLTPEKNPRVQRCITGCSKNAREDFFCDQNCGPASSGKKYEILMDLRGFRTFAFTLTVLILVDCPVTYDLKRYCLTTPN